ncbi:MAG: FHA domain-containing protein [Chloroflexi bacterium]|nr:FHA domain-containing protein [Chloroflexota bacterium]
MPPTYEPVLVIEGGPNDGETIQLHGRTTTMGRQPDNNVFVPEAGVSRHHAEIVGADTGYCLRDLYSTNGTLVNNKKVPEGEYLLKHGDIIRLASSEASFVFRSTSAATQQITLAQPAVGMPSTESDEDPPSDAEALSDEAELYEGTVHLTLRVEGGLGLIFSFTQQVRQMPELRLLRLNNNPMGGADIWLGLREPVSLGLMLLQMEGVAEANPNTEGDVRSLNLVLRPDKAATAAQSARFTF